MPEVGGDGAVAGLPSKSKIPMDGTVGMGPPLFPLSPGIV